MSEKEVIKIPHGSTDAADARPTSRVFHVTPQHVRVVPAEGYTAAIMVGEKGADIFFISADDMESMLVKLEGPKPGQRIAVIANDDGSYDVTYKDTI